MKAEKTRRWCVKWVEYGTMYFRWYKTKGAAINFAKQLESEGHPVFVWTK